MILELTDKEISLIKAGLHQLKRRREQRMRNELKRNRVEFQPIHVEKINEIVEFQLKLN